MREYNFNWRAGLSALPPPGQWDKEPDKIQWVDKATDLDCLMHRSPLGAWCGYVGVPAGHPYFQKEYDDVSGIKVHGGLTYSAFCQDTDDESQGVCHVPEPGRPHKVWWFGFDCAHGFDMTPGALPYNREHGVYRNRRYVTQQVTRLAKQLMEVT
jgi:hypothetical protein